MKSKFIKILFKFIIFIIVMNIIVILYVKVSTQGRIYKDINKIPRGYNVAIILGAAVNGDIPSKMLEDRLIAGIELYKNGKVSKLIMSGDGRTKEYNEVRVMKLYAIKKGVAQNDILVDAKGLNTSSSMINLIKKYNKNDNYIVVSQKFHLSRAIFLADRYGLNAIAYQAKDIKYDDLLYLNFRECFAILKDFYMTLIRSYYE